MMGATPGQEESILKGITSVTGDAAKIFGGSAGDNTIAGNWQVFWSHNDNFGSASNGVVLSFLAPSVKVSVNIYAGYSATPHKGVATRSVGRCLYELDGRPAADVYNDWAEGVFEEKLGGGVIAVESSLCPLARVVGRDSMDQEVYKLIHPFKINPDKSIAMFSVVHQGMTYTRMTTTRRRLAEEIPRQTIEGTWFQPSDIRGAFVVYCKGSSMQLEGNHGFKRLWTQLRTVLGSVPFTTIFTFGEQGTFFNGEIDHGNNMVSTIVFSSIPKVAKAPNRNRASTYMVAPGPTIVGAGTVKPHITTDVTTS